MERTYNESSKRMTNRNTLLAGFLIAFALLAVVVAYLTFTGVRRFIASWNLTNLPGISVSAAQDPTPDPLSTAAPIPGVAAIPVLEGPRPEPWDGASRVNMLVMGLDYRDWEAGEGAPRTDTMILLSIDPVTKTAGILSIPRDLWVSMPGFEDANRINTAYRFGEIYKLPGGGPELAMKTVEGVLGLDINYYALIDFFAFEKFIDELGGIKVDVDKTIKVDPIEGNTIHLKAGPQVLPGNLALAYARARNTKGSDFDRAKRQQKVIMGIRNRIMSSNALPGLIARAPAIYNDLASGIHTNLNLNEAIQLAWLAQEIPEEDIKRGVIGTEQVTFGVSPEGDQVLKPRPEQVRILRDEIFTASGPASPAQSDLTSQELMQAENAKVSVLNGSGSGGLADQTADYLKADGVNVTETGDAPEPYAATTIISYTGNPYTVKYLVEKMNIVPSRIYHRYDPSSPVDVVLYLGYDWANTNPMP
jgi:polyisoprenyl-teichoic acid--peptidoglycan teichoic acid transferase